MLRSVVIVVSLALGACATRPPDPPTCAGELVPINASTVAGAAK